MSRILASLEGALLVITIAGMFFIVMFQVVTRVLGIPTGWAEELTRYLFVWMVLIGAGLGAKNNEHVGTDYFISLLPKKWELAFRRLGLLLFLVFCALMVHQGVKQCMVLLSSGQTIVSLPIPKVVFFACIPLGFTFAGLHLVMTLFAGKVKKAQNEGSEIAQ
ncbi:MAG: TRAP transporter small permease [Bacillota bacterium]